MFSQLLIMAYEALGELWLPLSPTGLLPHLDLKFMLQWCQALYGCQAHWVYYVSIKCAAASSTCKMSLLPGLTGQERSSLPHLPPLSLV